MTDVSKHRIEISCQEEGWTLELDLTDDEMSTVRKVQAALNVARDNNRDGAAVGPWISVDDEIGAW